MDNIREEIKKAETVVVKIGTSSLTHANGKMQLGNIERLARVLSDLQNQGRKMILISSGAIGVGCGILSLDERPKSTRKKQAIAAIGQCELMSIYSKFFGEYGQNVAQILLTKDVVSDKTTKKNVVNTFKELMKMGVIPIVNENDSVSTEEIKAGKDSVFNENDMLAAVVAKLINADLLIILSDIDGFYDGDPKENKDSKIISVITEMTPEIEDYAGGAGSFQGTGGMITKLKAAQAVVSAGIHMILGSGQDPEILRDILMGEPRGSFFVGNKKIK